MKKLLIIIAALLFVGCAGDSPNDQPAAEPATTGTTTDQAVYLRGFIEPLKGPCFSGGLDIQPVECATLAEVGSSTSYSLNGYNNISYQQTQPTNCAAVTGALSCYSETTKAPTVGTVDLAAYVDFSATPNFTVNVLSKIAGGCVALKARSGMTLAQADLEAKNALLSALGLPADSSYNSFAQLDFKGSEQRNELLVAMSAILQKWGADDGSGINSAVTQLQNDFADCNLSAANVQELWRYGNQVDYGAVRSNLVDLYSTKYSTAATPASDSGLIAYLRDSDLDGVRDQLDDDSPAAFEFSGVASAEPYTSYSSNAVTISGLGAAGSTQGRFTGGVLLKNGAQASESFTAVNGDTFSFSLISGGFGSTTTASLTIGNTTRTYSVAVRTPQIGLITGTGPVSHSTNNGAKWLATKITPTTSISVKYIGFEPNCQYNAISIYSDNGGKPGVMLATSTSINASAFFGPADYSIQGGGTSKLVWPSATLANRYELTAGTTYHIVAQKTSACNLSTYESGGSAYSNDNAWWTPNNANAYRSFLVN